MMFQRRKLTSDAGGDREPVWNLTGKKQKKKIAVIGISRGAGTTFVSASLAFLLASVESEKWYTSDRIRQKNAEQIVSPAQVSLLEMQRPREGESMLYYAAALDRRFREKRFTDFFALHVQGKSLPLTANLHKGINWVVWRHPATGEERMDLSAFPLEQMPGTYIIADSPPLDTLRKYDLVIGVLDPMPAAVYAGSGMYEQLRDLETCGLPVLWVLNRDHSGVNHSALQRFLKLKNWIAVPELGREVFYKAEYSGRLAAEVIREEEKNTPGHEPGVFEILQNEIMQLLLQT